MYRTHNCGELSLSHVEQDVTLSGWVTGKREMGPILFIILSDRYGKTQIVFEKKDLLKKAEKISLEDVIKVRGKVRDREENRTDAYFTGFVEVEASDLSVLNSSLPMPYDYRKEASDTIKLQYRYLDIRHSEILDNLVKRAEAVSIIRKVLNEKGFTDVETPVLNKSTPEGARDFLVPSRIHPGSFYALPQSPQIFKQLLMISGLDKYYQIVKCFRDEDLRADRQPEFTQIDIEMSFAEESDVMELSETMVCKLFSSIRGEELEKPFKKMSYREALEKYGTDSPDLRFGLSIKTLDDFFVTSDFKAFKTAAEDSEKTVSGLLVPGKASYFSRNKVKKLEKSVQGDGAKGLAFIKKENGELSSPVMKFFGKPEVESLDGLMNDGDILFIIADDISVARTSAGNLRKKLGHQLDMIDGNKISPVWIVDFPAFEFDKDENRWITPHHPFTDFNEEDLNEDHKLGSVVSRAYDLVINGHEVGGGSIRIHSVEKQKKVFSLLDISEEEAEKKFGFFLKALQYGAPPHGGIAFGLDRLLMVLLSVDAIRDIIAFPKTTSAACLMSDAPDFVEEKQYLELNISVRDKCRK